MPMLEEEAAMRGRCTEGSSKYAKGAIVESVFGTCFRLSAKLQDQVGMAYGWSDMCLLFNLLSCAKGGLRKPMRGSSYKCGEKSRYQRIMFVAPDTMQLGVVLGKSVNSQLVPCEHLTSQKKAVHTLSYAPS